MLLSTCHSAKRTKVTAKHWGNYKDAPTAQQSHLHRSCSTYLRCHQHQDSVYCTCRQCCDRVHEAAVDKGRQTLQGGLSKRC